MTWFQHTPTRRELRAQATDGTTGADLYREDMDIGSRPLDATDCPHCEDGWIEFGGRDPEIVRAARCDVCHGRGWLDPEDGLTDDLRFDDGEAA